MKNILPAVLIAAISGGIIAVADGQSSADRLQTKAVGLALKTCIKTYLANADFQILKNGKIAEINRKTEPQFEADYDQAWPVLKKCPFLVSKYRLRQNTTKEEVLKIVGRLTRNDCLKAVDNIPDEVIVEQFNNSLNDPEFQNKPLNERINLVIKKLISGNGG